MPVSCVRVCVKIWRTSIPVADVREIVAPTTANSSLVAKAPDKGTFFIELCFKLGNHILKIEKGIYDFSNYR